MRTATASRLPQSRRLRLLARSQHSRLHRRLKIAAVAATAAINALTNYPSASTASRLPQSRRLRLNRLFDSEDEMRPASRLPQSRRLRLGATLPGFVLHSAASRLPQSRRLRPQPGCKLEGSTCRLKIAAVAATAATGGSHPVHQPNTSASRLPQSRRLRQFLAGSYLKDRHSASRLPQSRRLRLENWVNDAVAIHRLKIAAVAATAATAEVE